MGTNPSVADDNVIDQRRVHGDLVFATNRDRGLYIGTSISDQPRWLKEHAGSWRRIENVQREAAALAPPAESEIKVGAAPAGPSDQTSSDDVRQEGDAEDDVTLVDTAAGDCSSSPEPASQPKPVTEPVANGTTKAEPLRRTEAAVSEATGSKTETTPFGVIGRKRGGSGGRQPKKQKQPAGNLESQANAFA